MPPDADTTTNNNDTTNEVANTPNVSLGIEEVDERAYYRLIDDAAMRLSNQMISNGKPDHAVYLIVKFLTTAKRTVRIYSGRLSRYLGDVPVYADEELLRAVRTFLSRQKTRLLIVTQHPLDTDETGSHPLINVVQQMRDNGELGGVLEFREATDDALEFFRRADYAHHWQLMDEQAYRLEHDTDRAKAHVNFGTQEIASVLARLFDTVLLRNSPDLRISRL